MTVYDRIKQLLPGVLVVVKERFAKREYKLYSHEADKLYAEDFRWKKVLDKEMDYFINKPAFLMVEIFVKEPDTEKYGYQYRFGKSVNQHNKIAEFACLVCHKKMKKEHPDCIDCAFRGIDNEYCPELLEALEEFNHANRT